MCRCKLDLEITITVEKKDKIGKKFFKNVSLSLGLHGYTISGPLDRIFKNPSTIHQVNPLGGPMQNFIQFGPVVSSIECLGTKMLLRIL